MDFPRKRDSLKTTKQERGTYSVRYTRFTLDFRMNLLMTFVEVVEKGRIVNYQNIFLLLYFIFGKALYEMK